MPAERRVSDVVHTGGAWLGPKVVRIPDLFSDETYIARLVLFRTPWGGVYVHKICLPDGERDPHNHPRTLWSLVLRGGYRETVCRADGGRWPRVRRRWSWQRLALDEFHAITALDRVPTWTLLVVGPERQPWGFLTPGGFVAADDYRAVVEYRIRQDLEAGA